mgnify:CR=1 FL=1
MDYYKKIKNELTNNDNEINNIFDNIKDLVINSRNKVYQTVNTEMLNLYWNIGKAIMEIQQGDERASYGDSVLDKLSIRARPIIKARVVSVLSSKLLLFIVNSILKCMK